MSAVAAGFDQDAAPEVTASACEVCAFYVANDIGGITSIKSRPIRLLLGLLEQFSEAEELIHGRTPATQVIVRLAVLRSMAVIFSKNPENEIFAGVIEACSRLWMTAIVEYSNFYADETLFAEDSPKNLYLLAIKENTLSAYEDSWYKIIFALSQHLKTVSASDSTFIQSFLPILVGTCIQHLDRHSTGEIFGYIMESLANFLCVEAAFDLLSKSVQYFK